MTKKKPDQRPVYKGAINELYSIRVQLGLARGVLEEAMRNVETLVNLFNTQLNRAEGKPSPMEYVKEVDITPLTKLSYGHMFDPARPARQGMNHTADEYRVCILCGRSDVSLQSEVKEPGGPLPQCKSQK